MALCYFLIAVMGFYSIGSFHASFVTKYTRISPVGSFDIALCMDIIGDTNDICGLRLTNTLCEHLDHSWCELNPEMSNEYTYLKKSEITEFPLLTNFTHFERNFPINFTVGSEVEIKFAWHTGCTGLRFRINFKDDVGNFVFHVNVDDTQFYSSSKILGTSWDGSFGYNGANTFGTIADVQYTLKIVRGTNGYLVYMDGVEEWEHPYDPKYSPQNITLLDSKFKGGVQGDVYQLTFKSG
ncbi:hypothetical protein ACF0H5_015317 [Mactra antiquata]